MGEHRKKNQKNLKAFKSQFTKTAILRTVAEVKGDIKQIQVVATVLTNHPAEKRQETKKKRKNQKQNAFSNG